jgi:antitoxin (DNA-binding transcriptional repressor) of toxin-antitoxin stability system
LEILLTRSGRPVARITGVRSGTSASDSYGLFKGQFKFGEDFDADSAAIADLFGVPR